METKLDIKKWFKEKLQDFEEQYEKCSNSWEIWKVYEMKQLDQKQQIIQEILSLLDEI
jgi:hypothetical protein